VCPCGETCGLNDEQIEVANTILLWDGEPTRIGELQSPDSIKELVLGLNESQRARLAAKPSSRMH
jgi:hypothetical protein